MRTLRDLMLICYDAGKLSRNPLGADVQTFDEWWEKYGQRHHDDYAAFEEVDEADRGEEVAG